MTHCSKCAQKCTNAVAEGASRFFSTASRNGGKFKYAPLLQCSDLQTKFQRLEALSDQIEVIPSPLHANGFLKVPGEVLRALTHRAFEDIEHLLRPSHLQQLSSILKDDEASPNDKAVALELLKNACIAAGKVLPGCQDTGTAIIMGKKGQSVITTGDDEESISHGVYDAYTLGNLRYSMVAPLDMFTEKNTGSNLPAQIDIAATGSDTFDFLFIAKGGGSANKTFLFQQTKALLAEDKLYSFIEEKVRGIGTSACPPYHLAIVIGGLSAEHTLKTVKLASCRYLDTLPTSGDETGRAYRDLEWESKILEMTRKLGIGAQFGGKYFCHDVRVIRLPRHGASLPIGLGVSCSADRQALAKISKDGVFLEQLETNPAQYLPSITESDLGISAPVSVNLNQPMDQILALLSQYPTKTRLALTGTLIVARDIAHMKLMERLKKEGSLPSYVKDHPIYYAGPAKTPEGKASGSFGPTTAGRMDPYLPEFMAAGGSMITIAKGNRSKMVTEACKKHKGFYLGCIGGAAAILAENCIKKVEVLEYPELGMEAIWKIEVEDFPAFIIVDDKGNDFFKKWMPY